jgi:hypothetical protein
LIDRALNISLRLYWVPPAPIAARDLAVLDSGEPPRHAVGVVLLRCLPRMQGDNRSNSGLEAPGALSERGSRTPGMSGPVPHRGAGQGRANSLARRRGDSKSMNSRSTLQQQLCLIALSNDE